MAQLPGNFSANLAGNPVSGGRAATADDYGNFGDLGKGIRDAANSYQSDQEDDESRKALIGSTQVRAKYAKIMDEATLTGADIDEIKVKMNDELAQIGATFNTKRGADSLDYYTANSDIMFQQKAQEIKVTRATVNARLDASKFLNAEGATLQTNPAYLPMAEKNADDLAATWNGTTAEKRLEIADGLKKDLNMAAAMASARSDPKGTKDALQAGKWNLSPEQRNTAENFAQGRANEQRADQVAARAQSDYEARKRNEAARDSLFKGIMAGTTKQGEIMDHPDLDAATREHLIEFKEQRARSLQAGDRKSNPVVLRNLYMAYTAPDGTQGKQFNGNAIFEALGRGEINVSDANFLNNVVAGQKDENGRTLSAKLNNLMGTVQRAMSQDPQFIGQPALVASAQMDFQARVFERTETLRKANQDPSQVFNPASKDYVGSPAFIQPSISAARQARTADANSAAPVVKDRAEYDKLPEGATYRDTNGNVSTKKGKPVAQTSEADKWMAATGGRLKPGQTQAQAIQAWGQDANFNEAKSALHLNAQEQNLYEHHLANLRGGLAVHNSDGSTSTVYQAVVEHDGKFYNIPTVWGGKILDVPEAAKRAASQGWGKWPSYKTADQADARYEKMHDFMERDIK